MVSLYSLSSELKLPNLFHIIKLLKPFIHSSLSEVVNGLFETPFELREPAASIVADAADVDALLSEPQVGVVGAKVQPEFCPEKT